MNIENQSLFKEKENKWKKKVNLARMLDIYASVNLFLRKRSTNLLQNWANMVQCFFLLLLLLFLAGQVENNLISFVLLPLAWHLFGPYSDVVGYLCLAVYFICYQQKISAIFFSFLLFLPLFFVVVVVFSLTPGMVEN